MHEYANYFKAILAINYTKFKIKYQEKIKKENLKIVHLP